MKSLLDVGLAIGVGVGTRKLVDFQTYTLRRTEINFSSPYV
jgi:hypothetical protein